MHTSISASCTRAHMYICVLYTCTHVYLRLVTVLRDVLYTWRAVYVYTCKSGCLYVSAHTTLSHDVFRLVYINTSASLLVYMYAHRKVLCVTCCDCLVCDVLWRDVLWLSCDVTCCDSLEPRRDVSENSTSIAVRSHFRVEGLGFKVAGGGSMCVTQVSVYVCDAGICQRIAGVLQRTAGVLQCVWFTHSWYRDLSMDSRCSVFGFRIVYTGMCCSGVDR